MAQSPNTYFLYFFSFLFFWILFIYLRERDRDRESTRGEERERQAPRRAGGSPMWDLIPGPRDHDLSRRQLLNQLSHPSAPVWELLSQFFKKENIYNVDGILI